MKVSFIEYYGDIYVVQGITYDDKQEYPECYVATLLTKDAIIGLVIIGPSINIPFAHAIEITDKNRLKALKVLYA